MNAAVRGAAVTLVLGAMVATLVLGGCRGAVPTVMPPAPVTGVPADPLAGAESAVEAVERDLDDDAGAAGR